ncbi:MAG TPA: carboxypeptidase-like regulatory domain-containing protein, partial [Prolixibacteraceae bacterium]|nr:carboxypeptidase-like regulatory domain-containing protein [Prolixibacteraceae bacterium]
MRIALCTLLLSLLIPMGALAQKHTISGYIRDTETGEELIGANVMLEDKSAGTTSNAYGFYSLTLPDGTYTITYSFIGYQEQKKTLDIYSDKKINIDLKP